MEIPSKDAKPTVLVVDDEFMLRVLAVDFIEDAGFEAVEAENADEAISILESRTDITIVMTDVNMPGTMDGLRFAATIRDRWPPIEIVIVSGHLGEVKLVLPERAVFFSKPYNIDVMIRCLQRMAARSAICCSQSNTGTRSTRSYRVPAALPPRCPALTGLFVHKIVH